MITLEKFNENNQYHIKTKRELENDEFVTKNICSIIYPNNLTYVIKNENNYIGFIKLNKEQHECYSIDCAILNKYTNNHYGTKTLKKLLTEIKNIILEYNKLIIRTDYKNIEAIKASKNAGFKVDYDEISKCDNEGVNYIVLTTTNNHYNN